MSATKQIGLCIVIAASIAACQGVPKIETASALVSALQQRGVPFTSQEPAPIPQGDKFRFDEGITLKGANLWVDVLRISDRRVFGWNAVLDIVRHHHERLDGSGYPLGLMGNQISLRTRCVSVADVFSALTENRPYRAAMSAEAAFRILSDAAESGQLDQEVVGALGAGLGLAAVPS